MNDFDKQLGQALGEGGDFDPERAAAQKQQLHSEFAGRMKIVERYLWSSMILMLFIAAYAVGQFYVNQPIKVLIGYGIVILIAYMTTVLLKLWYWVISTRIVLMKEVKQLRLDLHAFQQGHGVPESGEEPEPLRGLSRSETLRWRLALIAVCGVGVLLAFLVGGRV